MLQNPLFPLVAVLYVGLAALLIVPGPDDGGAGIPSGPADAGVSVGPQRTAPIAHTTSFFDNLPSTSAGNTATNPSRLSSDACLDSFRATRTVGETSYALVPDNRQLQADARTGTHSGLGTGLKIGETVARN